MPRPRCSTLSTTETTLPTLSYYRSNGVIPFKVQEASEGESMTTSMTAEVRYLTYSRGDLHDRTIDTECLQRECPLDQKSSKSSITSSGQQAIASIGWLDKLPPETIQCILSNLDLATLTLLRSISRRMNLLVSSVFSYNKAVTHAPDALRALLSTGAAHYFTAIDLYKALREQECFLCGDFGPFLYLLECHRYCWRCISSIQDLLPISKEAAQFLYHLDLQTMASLPTMINIPGFYGMRQCRRPDMKSKGGARIAMVAYGAARKAGTKLQALTDDYEKAKLETRIALRGPVAKDLTRDMDCMNYDPVGFREGYGLEPQRFMAAVRFPTLIAGTDAVEWGISCLGCLERSESGAEERLWNEQYTTEGMVVHLERCQKARKSWVSDRVTELEEFR